MCSFRDRYIILVVSVNEHNGSSTSSEIYDIRTNRWSRLPNLNFHYQNLRILVVNDRYLYKFSGTLWKPKIEYLDLVKALDKNQNTSWIRVKCTETPNGDFSFQKYFLQQIAPDKVLLAKSNYELI